TKPRETLEDDAGEAVPVADEIGEDADEERFLHETSDNVLVGAPRPEKRGERHVDDDQRLGDEGDLAAEKAKAAVDVLGEDRKEAIDDACPAHGVTRPSRLADRPARQ